MCMDLKQILLSSLPIIAKLTDGFVAVTDHEGLRLKVIDSAGNSIHGLENRRLDLAAKAIEDQTVLSGPSELARDAEMWAIPMGEYALIVTDDGKKQKQIQLEYSLKESLSLIANVIGGEASLFDGIGQITHSVNRDGSINDQFIGEINKDAYTTMSINKSQVVESSVIPGGKSILIPITTQVGLELSSLSSQEKESEKKESGNAKYTFEDMIGHSEPFIKAKNLGMRAAKSVSPILLLGETGTGKEWFAHAIHNASDRFNQKFIALNCGSIPSNLIESILFGYESGTFTGGSPGGKKGLFIEADRGTLFLDEIGEMDVTLQTRLLRVLQEKEVMPLGSLKSQEVDVRIIAATNKNIEQLIEAGEFREDLYYRLNVFPIDLPPLRERREDIEDLVNNFIKELNITLNKRITGCSQEALKILRDYHWSGNIRQLRNCVERAANIVDDGKIDVEHLPDYLFSLDTEQGWSIQEKETLDDAVKRIEKELIEQALVETHNNKQEAAKRLGISTTTLWRKINNEPVNQIKRIK